MLAVGEPINVQEQRASNHIAAANGTGEDAAFGGAVTPPIYLSSTFTFEGFDRPRAYDYSRSRNPTRDVLADTIARLEGGAGAVVVATGMAAVDLSLSCLEPGDLIIAPHDCYAGTWRLLTARQAKRQYEVVFVDQRDEAALGSALARSPKVVLIETPSNPLMRVVDIQKIAALAKAAGAKTVVDNTFLSPALQRPISLGADLVVHSTTKFLNGHSDVVGGAVVAAAETEAAELPLLGQCHGRDRFTVRRVSHVARYPHVVRAGGKSAEDHAVDRGISQPSSVGFGRALSRPGLAPRSCDRQIPAKRVRLDAEL